MEQRYTAEISKHRKLIHSKGQEELAKDRNLSKGYNAIRPPQPQALRYTATTKTGPDGGPQVEYFTSPADIDKSIRDAWKGIYKGNAADPKGLVNNFMQKYSKYIFKPEAPIKFNR